MASFRGSTFSLKNEQVRLSLLKNEEFSFSDDIPYIDGDKRFNSPKFDAQGVGVASATEKPVAVTPSIYSPFENKRIPPPPSSPPWSTSSCCCVSLARFFVNFILALLFCIGLPLFLITWVIFGVALRLFVTWCACLMKNKVCLLPMSRVFGSGKGNQSAVLLVCTGECNFEKIKRHFTRAIKNKFGFLQKRISKHGGYLCHEQTPFDVENHVKLFGLCKNEALTYDDVLPYLEKEMWKDYWNHEEGIPQWEVIVIPRYSVNTKKAPSVEHLEYAASEMGRKETYAVIFRYHNGILSWKLIQELLLEVMGRTTGRVQSPFCIPTWSSFNRMEKFKIVLSCFTVAPTNFMRKVVGSQEDKFMGLRGKSDGRFSLGRTRSMRMQILEDIQDRTETSVDGILNNLVRISVRNLGMGQNLKILKKLTVVRLWRNGNEEVDGIDNITTDFIKWRSNLERLQASYLATDKGNIELAGQRYFNNFVIWMASAFPERWATWIHEKVTAGDVQLELWTSSDEPCFLFGDDVVTDMYGWSGNVGGISDFKTTMTIYCGRIRAGVVAKLGKLSSDLTGGQTVANEMEEEYDQLAYTSRIPHSRLFIDQL